MSIDNKQSSTSIAMGLDAIFSAAKSDSKNNNNIKQIMPMQTLHVSDIDVSPFQARQYFSESALTELAASMKQHGVLQPLLVRKNKIGHYELLAGERRLRAAKLISLPEVPVIECDVDDATAMAFGLIENIQRQDLNVIEEAEALEKLLHEFQLSHDLLSEKIGKSRSHITNLLRLNKVDGDIKNHLMSGDISMGHARALLSLPTDLQLKIVKHIIANALSVRETENLVKKLTDNKNAGALENKFSVSAELKNSVSSWQQQLHQHYHADIKINFTTKGRAKVSLEVDSPEKLSALIDQLTSHHAVRSN